jgi:energy-coupling factor transporter ATP-binding protein EcfA2
MKSSFVYVHGTNGSGKSTLARAVLAAAGGVEQVEALPENKKATWTWTNGSPTVLLGKYGNACGGMDGFQPYEDVHQVVSRLGANGFNVFGEGLITPGVETCYRMAQQFYHHAFIFLDTPVEQCVANVLKRRARKANDKEYNPANLYKKHQSAASWADRLEKAGLQVFRAQYPEALRLTLARLSLTAPSLEDLLN